MLANSGIDRLYRVQPCHFPGIVADISLESLSSPSADDNQHYMSRSQAILQTHPEINEADLNDINKNIESDKVLNSLTFSSRSTIIEANANGCYSSSILNQMGKKSRELINDIILRKPYTILSPENQEDYKLSNEHLYRNDYTILKDQSNEHLYRNDYTILKDQTLDGCVPTDSGDCNFEAIHNSSNCKIEPIMSESSDISSSIISTDSDCCKSVFEKHFSESTNNDIQSIPTKNKIEVMKHSSQEKHVTEMQQCSNDKENVSIISTSSLQDHKLSDDRNLYPIVNIRTLGDGTDGSYEINIHNLYTASLSPAYTKQLYYSTSKAEVGNLTDGTPNSQYTTKADDSYQDENHIVPYSKPGVNYRGNSFVEQHAISTDDENHPQRNRSHSRLINERPDKNSPIDYNCSGEGVIKKEVGSINNYADVNSSDDLTCNKFLNDVIHPTTVKDLCVGSKDNIKVRNGAMTKQECNNLLFRSYSDEGCQQKGGNEENQLRHASASDIYDIQRKRRRRPRKLPEIPKQKRKDLHLNLQLDLLTHHQQKLSTVSSSPLSSSVIKESKPTSIVLSLADELRLAMCSSNEDTVQSSSEGSTNNVSTTHNEEEITCQEPGRSIADYQNAHQYKEQNDAFTPSIKMATSMVKSIVSLHELGSPVDIEPPSFRDSGFFGDLDFYNDELFKQQCEIQKQQQLLLRQLYKNRNRNSYASTSNAADCDSGYTTQDPECGQSRPSSAGPVLCRRCGSAAVTSTDADTINSGGGACDTGVARNVGGVFGVELTNSQTSDYYIDDVPKNSSSCAGTQTRPSDSLKDRTLNAEKLKSHDLVKDIRSDLGDTTERESHYENFMIQRMVEEKHLEKKILELKTKADEVGPHQPGLSDTESETDLEITHRCCHKFVPRHADELFIEIGDPIYVEKEDDDLWCEGVNLRTKEKGVFPSVCATDLNFLDGEGDGSCKPVRHFAQLLGSVQVKYAKGTHVLTQAINKVAMSRRMTLTTNPPAMCCLEINNYGIRLSDKKARRPSTRNSMPRSLSQILGHKAVTPVKEEDVHQAEFNHFYSLKNVTFCGSHSTNQKYFAFITKHPLESKFACHVLLSEGPTSCISEAIGASFKRYYQQYLAATHPTEDIYLEN